MKKDTKICVYCSSQSGLSAEIVDMADRLGRWIGEHGFSLVYGGVNAGLMHQVAQSAGDAGAEVIGIVPEVFRHRADEVCSRVILTSDLNTRKAAMIDMADIFVVLPGGIGTIDEWISTLSHIMVASAADPSYDKAIVAVDYEGMYSGMRKQLQQTAGSVFARGRRIDRTLYAADAAGLIAILDGIVG